MLSWKCGMRKKFEAPWKKKCSIHESERVWFYRWWSPSLHCCWGRIKYRVLLGWIKSSWKLPKDAFSLKCQRWNEEIYFCFVETQLKPSYSPAVDSVMVYVQYLECWRNVHKNVFLWKQWSSAGSRNTKGCARRSIFGARYIRKRGLSGTIECLYPSDHVSDLLFSRHQPKLLRLSPKISPTLYR